MLLNDARRDARFADGTIVLLRDHDRSLWDFDQIDEGRAVLDRALALGGRGDYAVQAAIAALHVDEPQDWPQIAALYGELARLTGFFFQAEDGIRDVAVTGVQTCALPISIPVIFLTAKSQEAEIQRGLSLGAAGYVTKPFDALTLGQHVKDIVSQINQ